LIGRFKAGLFGTLGMEAVELCVLHPTDFGSFLAILVKRSKAVSSSSAISAAMMSGAGRESVSVRLLSLIQKTSRLSLSRFWISSLS
jgi:hypothetical protein